VLVDSEPVLYLERGGRSLLTLGGEISHNVHVGSTERALEPVLRGALQALAEAIRAGRVGRIALERIDGEPAIGSALHALLVEVGAQVGPRRLTLRA
jgi:ATP-dependent helicase Lhr and Lhr-like helicase